jgi:hypothetical protein
MPGGLQLCGNLNAFTVTDNQPLLDWVNLRDPNANTACP